MTYHSETRCSTFGPPRLKAFGDRGSVSVVELPFGFLWIGAVAVVVLTFPGWVERTQAARAAADEAARTMVLADSWDTGSTRAQLVVDETATNHGFDPGDLSLALDGDWGRGAEITAHVTVAIPAVDLPLLGQIGSMTRTVSHTERIDQYRSLEP